MHRIQIEFFSLYLEPALVVLARNALFLSLRGAVGGLSAIEFGIAVDLNQDFGFAQENVGELLNIRARQPRFERQ